MNDICISGQMRSGKNVTGEYICNCCKKYIPASFAKPVKEIFCKAFNVDQDFIEYWKVRKDLPEGFNKNIRQALQFIGDGFRSIKNDVWIQYAMQNNPEFSCYLDGRYLNELKNIKLNKGYNILLYRPGFENNDPNPSEAQIKILVDYFCSMNKEGDVSLIRDIEVEGSDLVDFFIINDGSLEDLYKKIDSLIIPYIS